MVKGNRGYLRAMVINVVMGIALNVLDSAAKVESGTLSTPTMTSTLKRSMIASGYERVRGTAEYIGIQRPFCRLAYAGFGGSYVSVAYLGIRDSCFAVTVRSRAEGQTSLHGHFFQLTSTKGMTCERQLRVVS